MVKTTSYNIDRLNHISDAVGLILKFTEGKSEADFLNDQMISSSVLFQFIIIGESVSNIDQALLEKYRYPWHLPKSFRNYIVHKYFGINLKQVYKTITAMLPEFKILIDRMIEEESEH
jgi:uncharacterized protein with HEPN domain